MIKQLNQESILHISTSSTLQSLASFVKELIENSIDAKATQIVVNFFNSGKEGFEVIDNGIGISTQNQKQLATRGGTSKIQNFEDMEFVLTHGFRGEALNSIATLSNVTIISKHKDEELGWKWEIPQEPIKIARQTGTSIRVENIFYTLPVRVQEFKKNFKVEYNKAINILTEYAIINTNIEFKIYNEEEKNKKKLILDSGLSNENIRQRIINVLGDSIANDLIPFEKVYQDYTLNGFLSKSIESGSYKGQARKTFWYCYINKKPINPPKQVLQVMREIYRQHNPNGNFFFILEINLRQISDADFNVSVDKRDVYLKNEKLIVENIEQVVNETLEKNKEKLKLIGRDGNLDQFIVATAKQVEKQVGQQNIVQIEKRKDSTPLQTKEIQKRNSSFLSQLKNFNSQKNISAQINQQNVSQSTQQFQDLQQQQLQQEQQKVQQQQIQLKQSTLLNNDIKLEPIMNEAIQQNDEIKLFEADEFEELSKQNHFLKEHFNHLQIIGQFNKGFIICENQQKIYVLDQHACDEKFNYEKLINQLKFNRVQLIVPIILKLSGFQLELLIDNQQQINDKFKFQVEITENLIKLKTCPSYSNIQLGADALLQILDQLSQGKKIDQIELPQIKQKLASQACRTSIMVGADLQTKEMQNVVKNLTTLISPWNCPHGRPTLIQVQQPKQNKFTKGFSNDLLK